MNRTLEVFWTGICSRKFIWQIHFEPYKIPYRILTVEKVEYLEEGKECTQLILTWEGKTPWNRLMLDKFSHLECCNGNYKIVCDYLTDTYWVTKHLKKHQLYYDLYYGAKLSI